MGCVIEPRTSEPDRAVQFVINDGHGSTFSSTGTVTFVAGLPTLAVGATASGNEHSAISLNIALGPIENDDNLSITISGVPTDATLSAGTNNGDGSWTLTPAQLPGLTLFAGESSAALTVVATDSTPNSTVSSSQSIAVTVDALADVPDLLVPASVGGAQGTPIALGISVQGDSDDTLTVSLSNVPTSAKLTDQCEADRCAGRHPHGPQQLYVDGRTACRAGDHAGRYNAAEPAGDGDRHRRTINRNHHPQYRGPHHRTRTHRKWGERQRHRGCFDRCGNGCDLHRRRFEYGGERLHGDGQLGRRDDFCWNGERHQQLVHCDRRPHLCGRGQLRPEHDRHPHQRQHLDP